jgi:uncharacterized membrane protein YgcG
MIRGDRQLAAVAVSTVPKEVPHMVQRTFRMLVPALLAGGLLAGPPATRAAKDFPSIVRDDANLFSDKTRQAANKVIAAIKRQYKKDLLIVTLGRAESAKKLTGNERRKFFVKLAQERANTAKVDGVFVLICWDPKYVIQVRGMKTLKKVFTDDNLGELGNLLVKHLKAGVNDKDRRNVALTLAVKYVHDTLKKNLAK